MIDGIGVVEAIRRDDELTDVVTVSRPDRPYVAETLALPGIPKAGTPLPDEVRTKPADGDSITPSDANAPTDP